MLKDPCRSAAGESRIGAEPLNERPVIALAAYRFPHGDAMSNRLYQLARSARSGSRLPLVINDWPTSTKPEFIVKADGIELITISARVDSAMSRILARTTRPVRVVRAAFRAGIQRRDRPIMIIPQGLLSILSLVLYRLLLSCTVVVDMTERHDRRQFRRGALEPYFVRHRWTAYLARINADKVVAVSHRLAGHVERKLPVKVIPPQVDLDEYEPPSPPPISSGVRLVYAGTPGNKDMLNVILEGIGLLDHRDQDRLTLTIVGISASDAAESSDLDDAHLTATRARISLIGRVPRSEVHSLLAKSHFSVLIRPRSGYAEAGFPSKVPESLAAGCPVITTPTGDLGNHIHDGVEGVWVAESSATAISDALRNVLTIDDAAWRRMSAAARARAASDFDYRADPAIRNFFGSSPSEHQKSTSAGWGKAS